MINYTTSQIQSLALLILFGLWFLYTLYRLYQRFNDKSLLNKNRTLKKLKKLSWEDFEHLTMELFEKLGWSVEGNVKKGADGGVDIWMEKRSWMKQDVYAIVQCKRYEDAVVTVKVIREMYGLMHEYEVDEVYVVTTSRFTKECYVFSQGKKITLIDGEGLVRLIEK